MQATHGFAALSRSRTRLIGCLMAITLAFAALVLAFASPARAAEPPLKTYLAVGDSLSFGYSQELFNELFPKEKPKQFEEALSFGYGIESAKKFEEAEGLTFGYGIASAGKPNGFVLDYRLKLQAKTETAESQWKKEINNGCPGETTDSFIGIGPLGKALEGIISGSHGEAPCAYHNVNGFELHHEYEPGQSQLENALQVIATQAVAKRGSRPVSTITLQIGANDLLHGVASCEAEVKSEFEKTGKSIYGGPGPAEAVKGCLEAHAGIIFQHVLKNTAAALFAIRNGALFGGVNYMGRINVLGFYDPNGAVFTEHVELLPSSNTLLALLNFFDGKLTKEFGGCYANPQPRFNPLFEGKASQEPARLQAFTNMANTTTAVGGTKGKNGPDIHPTPLGYEELANIIEAKCP